MAEPWIEVCISLPDHRKVLALSDELQLDKDLIVGKLIRLWTWAITHRDTGVFAMRDRKTIAEVMRYKGKPDRLINALVVVGLLDQAEDALIIHDWDEHVEMLLAKRETIRSQTRRRVQKFRDRNRSETDGGNALQERYVTDGCNASNAATVPYRTIDDEEDDVDDTARTREDVEALREAQYAEADRIVRSTFLASFGRNPTPAEAERLTSAAIMSNKTKIIADAIQKAAVNGANSPFGYIAKILQEWSIWEIDTPEELGAFDYYNDVMNGRIGGMAPEEAIKEMTKRRDAKRARKGV